jgi:hypothetical protein
MPNTIVFASKDDVEQSFIKLLNMKTGVDFYSNG